MEQTSNAVTISSLPIIGIQHEVQDENGEVEVQVEYFALNPVKFIESLDDPEDASLRSLLHAVNSVLVLFADMQSKEPNKQHLSEFIVANRFAQRYFDLKKTDLNSEVVEKVAYLKSVFSKYVISINPGVN